MGWSKTAGCHDNHLVNSGCFKKGQVSHNKGKTNIVDGKKPCIVCGNIFEVSEFSKDISKANGLNSRCRSCEHLRGLKRRFGKEAPAHYIAKQLEQNNVCAICKKAYNTKLALDHNHETGVLRGLLCFKCNTAIGMFYEDRETLLNAINYLSSYEDAT